MAKNSETRIGRFGRAFGGIRQAVHDYFDHTHRVAPQLDVGRSRAIGENRPPLRVSVIIPATRPSIRDLVASLNLGSRRPDEIIVVSNEITKDELGPGTDLVSFWSNTQPIGVGDSGLRRDIGADLATGDIVVFLDDDQLAPRNLIEEAVKVVERDGFCWGNYRFIDFDAHSLEELIDLPPEAGRSRETFVNDWHGWQSSYAGMFAIRRDLFWKIGGFDLGFLGHHGSEDQQLGFRLSNGTHKTFVHEPPFAWHTDVVRFHSVPRTNITGAHRLVQETISGHQFFVCKECPWRKPVDIRKLAMSERVVIPYRREEFTLNKERL